MAAAAAGAVLFGEGESGRHWPMTTLQLITLAIACYGALLSTVALLRQLHNDRPRLRVAPATMRRGGRRFGTRPFRPCELVQAASLASAPRDAQTALALFRVAGLKPA